MTEAQRRQFDTHGFTIIDDVLTSAQVIQLRGALDRHLDSIGRERTDHVFEGCPELAWLCEHPPVVAELRELLGPNFVYCHDSDGVRGGHVAWHRDWELTGDDLIVKTCYYLEDQGREGGCLVVRPGSHLPENQEDPRSGDPHGDYADEQDCETRAGSVLIFHLRIWHRSRPRTLPGARHALFATYGKVPSAETERFLERWSKGLPYPAHMRHLVKNLAEP